MSTQLSALERVILKPRQWNFAGWCLYCDSMWCQEAKCASMHARSVWGVCTVCDGLSWLPDGDKCSCTHGMVEFAPLPQAPDQLADAPVSVPPATTFAPLPRCLTCGHRTDTPHAGCSVPATFWQPCTDCSGLRTDADGVECQTCCGVGFIELSAVDTLAERADDVPPWLVAAHA